MSTDEAPKPNLFVAAGLAIGLALLCAVCLGGGVLLYFYEPIFSDAETTQDSALESAPDTIESTATSVLDEALTSPVNQAVPPNLYTPTPQATATPILTATATLTATLSAPAQLPDLTASGYATLLLLEGSVFILEDVVQQMQAGELSETERNDILIALEKVFSLVGNALAQPPLDPVFEIAWGQAVAARNSANQVMQSWLIDQIRGDEVMTALVPIRDQVDEALSSVEEIFIRLYNLDLDRLSEARSEVRQVLWASLQSAPVSGASDATLPAPVGFSDTDLPLSDTLFTQQSRTYVSRILEIMENFSKAQERLVELKDQPPKLFVRDTRDEEMALRIATIQASSRIIKQIELPTDLAKTRTVLLTALADCDVAALYLASGLNNPEDFTTGLDFLERCNTKLDPPKQELESFAADQVVPATADSEEPAPLSAAPAATCREGCTDLQPGCIIKGEVEENGFKFYYLPGDRSYGQVQIDPARSERWFCTVDEAFANGWQSRQG